MTTRILCVLSALSVLCVPVFSQEKKELPLPTSKVLLTPAPGAPQRTNSLPVTMTVSPDGKYIALLNNGYGAAESDGRQSVAVLEVATNQVTDFPDSRLGQRARQTYFLGLAFSHDGRHLYASIASITDPEGQQKGSLGNGIAVYAFDNGRIAPERFIPIPLQTLAKGKRSNKVWNKLPDNKAVPYPAGLAVVNSKDGEQLLVADNLSDDALLIDVASGKIIRRFDLSTGDHVPAAYPYGVAVNQRGDTGWVSLWNTSQIAKLDLKCASGGACNAIKFISLRASKKRIATGSHPTAMLLDDGAGVLYITLANTDEIAVSDTYQDKAIKFFSTRLPGQKHHGAYPNALGATRDGRYLFVANASSDAVAVFKIKSSPITITLDGNADVTGGFHSAKLLGFVPTEWYPTALVVVNGDLFIGSGKGQSTGPNNTLVAPGKDVRTAHPFIASLLHGSVARMKIDELNSKDKLRPLTDEVLRSNLMAGRSDKIQFARRGNPIKHVIYVIKENRTYDQIFGDLKAGDGDPTLTMYGEDITPNQHKLARQFGIIDNFYDSGEVSGDGHVWSNAAITSDYTEKTWQIGYRGHERTYDYEGNVSNGMPLNDDIADVNEPGTGYLWTNLARHHRSYRHYGEFVTSKWCNEVVREAKSPTEGTPQVPGEACPKGFIKPGEPLTSTSGTQSTASPYGWPVPILASNEPTKPELRGHFDPNYADFRMDYPDQLRADEFLREFESFVRDKNLPQFITLRLPNDHTAGTRRDNPTPEAAVADNDLALGRVVDAVSHSPYWDSTAIFVLEDDAQNGADHVDAHRSTALAISKYAPTAQSPDAAAFVDHHFYTTVNLIHTMEVLLGLPPMNNNDERAAVMAPLFGGPGTQPGFTTDTRNRDNGLIYRANQANAPGSAESAKMDFTRADAADAALLNAILWRERKGNIPMPAPVHNMCGTE